MLDLSKKLHELDTVIQPYKWSNSSAEKIQQIFKEMNVIMDNVNEWLQENVEGALDVSGSIPEVSLQKSNKGRPKGSTNKPRPFLKATELHFPVPDMNRPNMGMWEGCSAYYIDKLTKAYVDRDKVKADESIYGLIDIGKAFDRELDPKTSAEDMLKDEDLRADSAKADYWRKLKYPDDTPEPLSKVEKLKVIIDTLSGFHKPNIEVDVDGERAKALQLLSEFEIV